jgi:subtilisin family serine protease
LTNVDLAAPGEQIYSTWAPSDTFYSSGSGTSFSAPYVSGALALLLAKYPGETYQQTIARLLSATDLLPSLAGKCVTGGRLNLAKALNPPIYLTGRTTDGGGLFKLHLASGPNRTCVIQVSTNLTTWSSIHTNTTAANGVFEFTNAPAANMPGQFFRAISSL